MTRISRVGIYGGTFNPIHIAHLRAAEEVAEALDLERVIFVPSAQPPHKRASEDDPIAPAEERLAWVRAAVAGNPRFDVDAIEVERGGCSFAVETLRIIGRKTAPELPVFIIGQDAFVELGSWREPQRLITLANFAVTTRPPAEKGSLAEWLPSVYEDAVETAPDGLSGASARGSVRALSGSGRRDRSHGTKRGLRSGRDARAAKMNENEHRSKVAAIAEAALDRKAEDIVALDVRELTSFADTFIIATGTSDRHTRSIADSITEAMARRGEEPLGTEGLEEGRWVLIDLDDVIVHVFQEEVRRKYDLERLWSDAPALDVAGGAAWGTAQ